MPILQHLTLTLTLPTTIGWSYGRQSLVKLVAKVHFMDFGKVHSIVSGIETVNCRPMAVCRPMDCTCICRTSNVIRGNFVYIQNFNCPVICIIFNTYVMMSYVVFKLQKHWFPDRLHSRPLRTAFGSDVAENAISIPVVNDSVDRATGDHCMPDFTAPVIDVK